MNLDPLSFSLSQIDCLVANLTKKNCKASTRELDSLVGAHGSEADKRLLRRVVDEACRGAAGGPQSAQAQAGQGSLLTSQPAALLNHPARVSVLCHAVDRPLPPQPSLKAYKSAVAPFAHLTRFLKLTTVQEVALCLALQNSPKPDVAGAAKQHLKKRLLDLVQCYLDTDTGRQAEGGGLQDCSPEILQLVLASLVRDGFGLAPVTRELFLERLRRDFPRELVPVILAPLLYPDDTETPLEEMTSSDDAAGAVMENSIADLILEMGYSFTTSVEECKMDLLNLGGREPTATDVARIASAMARTPSGLPGCPSLSTAGDFWLAGRDLKKDNPARAASDSWDVEVFVHTIKELAPNLNWKDVVAQLDHSEFIIKDRQGLGILFSILRLGLQTVSGYAVYVFPVECIYRHWTNAEGQMSLVTHILKNPDIFCFADHICHPVSVDILKSLPESDNKEIANWRSLHLVELLLHLGERGFHAEVKELFRIAVQHCPDVLLLALLQSGLKDSAMRHDLMVNLIPIFLGNHPNSAIILHHAWHNQAPGVKQIIMSVMSDWYTMGENDQSRLSRILDVAQDLKALSMLLNIKSFLFVIDLACLASRREYLKLDKWLSDKVREHGESFLASMVKFLQLRCPQVIGGKLVDEQLPKAAQLPPETVTAMLTCLQMYMNSVEPRLSNMIVELHNSCNSLLIKPRQGLTNVARSHRVIETPFNPSTGQMFNAPAVDPISTLGPNFERLALGPQSSTFTMPTSLGPLLATPGSPSRLIATGPSGSPFALLSLQHGANISNVGVLTRMGLASVDKRTSQDSMASTIPEINLNVAKDIEDEANGYFQRIYNHPPHPTLSIDEVLDMLKKFQDSPVKREREVYSCMLRNLFEEYRFFPQYPDKELHITAQLFGGLIERSLVTSYKALGLAFRFVLDALKKPAGTKMYYFGIAALDRFKSRLKDYHQYCEHIKTVDHFYDFPLHLREYVEYGLQKQEPPTKPQGAVFPTALPGSAATPIPGTPMSLYKPEIAASSSAVFIPKMSTAHANSRPSIANATNIDTLLVATDRDEKITPPPDSVQDKSAFIFNNLSQLNLQSKCDELRDIITEEYWPWLSQYLVLKRASIELNFHTLYSNFLDVLKIKEVNEMVTRETFRNIKVLLRSDKGIANFSDRSLLKNLGHWLGMLTLGRNRPILQIDIDLKSLILEAYHKGQQELLYVVPFVAKVLESCEKSKVFKPPNPWTMSIMNVLAELHQEPDLKLNLKFEIEVLCKNLNIDVAELKPAHYLRDPERAHKIEYQLSHAGKKNSTPTPVSQNLSTVTPSAVIPASVPPPEEAARASVTPTGVMPSEAGSAAVPGPPKFNYTEVNVSSNAAFGQNITISPNLIHTLFNSHPHLNHFIKSAIERSIQEWIHPVVDRSIKYALTTCEQIVRKDFALDPDEMRMRTSAHHMMRNLTAGMAMITCREQLLNTIAANVKSTLLTSMIGANPQQKEIIESAAGIIAADNMELACTIIQKKAVEKALPELDKRLMKDFEMRKIAMQEGRVYYDVAALNYQNERMHERVKRKVGVITEAQISVYDEFARNIPGFAPVKERDAALIVPKPVIQDAVPLANFNDSLNPNRLMYYGNDELGLLINDTEQFLGNIKSNPLFHVQTGNVHSLLECLLLIRRAQDHNTAFNMLQKAVEGLLDGVTAVPAGDVGDVAEVMDRYKEIHIRGLKLLQETPAYGHLWTNKQVARCLTECREDLKYNLEAIDCLLRSDLVNIQLYDAALVQFMDNGNNHMAVSFAMRLVQLYLVDERESLLMTDSDLYNTVEALVRIVSHSRQPPPDGLASLVEILRINQDPSNILGDRPQIGPTSYIHSGIHLVRVRDFDDDPPGLTGKTEYLLREWVSLYHNPPTSSEPMKNFNLFVQQMNMQGILKTDDLITRFFRIATRICINNIYAIFEDERMNPPETMSRNRYYHMTDAYVRLVALLIKNSGETGNTSPKINLLNKVLGITAGCLLQDHDDHGAGFQQLPYIRILLILFLELNQPEPVLESINFQVLTAFCHTLHMIRPSTAPAFTYAWIDFVSHRAFISRMLAVTPQQKGWSMYSQLLVALFKYIGPFLRNTELAKPVTLTYKGILKVLLVLLHDFPEFLCDYHYAFCDEIPPNCIQMRNLILSAFPRNMRLPDPFTPNLKVDLLSEITHAPRVLTNYTAVIQPISFKKDLDSYLKARAPVTFLAELRTIMQVSNEPGKRYNTQLMNAVVLYVGTQAIVYIRAKGLTPNMSTIAHSAHMDIFQNFAVDLDHEGRYIFLNAIANQLRYPNSHTHYFSCALLYLFAEANTEAIQEQITRMLLERLIVNRPHPWGLLITFIELIKNPIYKFWDHEFVHCAPEIAKLFESVARSCLVEKNSAKHEIEQPE